MGFERIHPVSDTFDPTAMKPTTRITADPARATVSAFTILIERTLHAVGQVLLLQAPALRAAPLLPARTPRRR